MLTWQNLPQQLRQLVNTVVEFAKARRREQAAIALAAILFWLGSSLIGWLPKELQEFVNSGRGKLIIPSVFYVAGMAFLVYGIYRIWKLTYIPNLPTPTNRPSAIKGPLAFTPDDGELFRKLGREDELRKLLGYIQDDQISLVVLMGASGAGKTSLLRAGLTDILKDTDINYHYWEAKSSEPLKSLLLAIQQSWDPKLSGATDGSNHPAPTSLDDLVNAPTGLGKHLIVLDQFEQMGVAVNGPIFRYLRKVSRSATPPHRVTWVVAFRREYRASWSDFIIPEQERGFFLPEISLRLFTSLQARDVISQLIQAADLSVEQKVVNNLIEAATVDGEVSSVDIGIGLLVLSELHERQGGETLTEDIYHFAGGAEGLLTQYINRCFESFPDEDRKNLLSAMLALSDENTGQRVAEGKTADGLAAEIKADNVPRLKIELQRLTQRDVRLLERVDVAEGDEIRYRLPHERLVPALSRLAGKLIGEREEARLKLSNAFLAWRKSHASQYLLKGRDLRLVTQYQGQIPWGSDEQEKLTFLRHSKRRRTAMRLISVLLVISLAAGGWLGRLQYQRYEAMKFLRENNYPPELYDYQHQLKSLDLASALNLKYIPSLGSDSLQELSITATDSTNSLEGLSNSLARCPHLTKLNISLAGSEVNKLPAWPSALTELSLDLSSSDVKELPALPASLTKLSLDLRANFVKEVPALPASLTELSLNLNSSQVRELPALPSSLTKLSLNLSSSNVKEVPALPSSLTELLLYLSDVKEVPALPSSLTKLSLHLSDVKEMPVLPNSLTELSLYLSDVEEVPALPSSLIKLSLHLSDVKEVPVLPSSLTELSLYLSDVKELPALPASLTKLSLDLRANFVKEVPALPASLTELSLNLNSSDVKEVPVLPSSLTKLSLYLNRSDVKEVPALPSSLTELSLYLDGSQVKEVPALPSSLTKLSLDLSYSSLITGPVLPGALTKPSFDPGIYLKEVPALPTTLTELSLDLDGSRVKQLPPLPSSLTRLSLTTTASSVRELPTLPSSLTELVLNVSGSEVKDLPPLPSSLTKLSLTINDSNVKELPPLQELNCHTLILGLTTEQRMSLKALPKTVTHLKL